MKIFRIVGRSIRDAFRSVFRNFSLSLASISCITITLIIVAFSIIAEYNVENFTRVIEKDVTMVVFIKKGINNEQVDAVRKEINSIKNVDSSKTVFKSQEEVSKEMASSNPEFSPFLNETGVDSPIKATFQLKVKNIEKIGDTAEKIEKIENVDSVKYGKGMVEQMVHAFRSISKGSEIAVIALVFVSFFLIINTIKLTIYSRKREIGIMRLVGASNFTIKTPFIIEGMVLGLVGSIIPIIIICYGYTALYQHFDGYLYSKLIQLVKPEPFIFYASLVVMLIGILVGMFGSSMAVRKYLKV